MAAASSRRQKQLLEPGAIVCGARDGLISVEVRIKNTEARLFA